MLFATKEILLRNGESALLRSAEPEDAKMLLAYLKASAAETPFLLRGPEEIRLSIEEERAFLRRIRDSERELMLLAELGGEHAGNASLSSLGPYRRSAHRCSLAVALYRRFWGLGLGRAMLQALLKTAETLGYEQAELQVNAGNTRAIALYRSLGFTVCGTIPNASKYPDGSCAAEHMMVKRIVG